MSFGRSLYQFLLSSSQAYAKWDLEVSTSIIKNRKKMLFLLALAAPILLVCGAEAYEAHEMLGGKSAYAPAFIHHHHFPGLHRRRSGGRPHHRLHRRPVAASSSPRP